LEKFQNTYNGRRRCVVIILAIVNDHRLKPVASGYGWKPDRSAIRPINPLSHRERAGERESNQQAVSS